MLMISTRVCSVIRVVAVAGMTWLSLFAAGAGQAVAADYYWDVNGTTAYGDGAGILRSSTSGTTWSSSRAAQKITSTGRVFCSRDERSVSSTWLSSPQTGRTSVTPDVGQGETVMFARGLRRHAASPTDKRWVE